MGATGDKDSQVKFDNFLRDMVTGKTEEAPEIPPLIGKVDCPMPPEGLVYDYLFEFKGRGKWTPWLDLIKDKTTNPNVKQLSDIIVPTMDTARWRNWLIVYILLMLHRRFWTFREFWIHLHNLF